MPAHYFYKHIVVVHGIGDQAPNETALGFMNEFIRSLPQGKQWELTVDNLIESVDSLMTPAVPGDPHVRSFQPANIVFSDTTDERTIVHVIGFSEVYWQPIARAQLQQNGGLLPVPIPTWARSISTRLLDPGYKMEQWRAAIENVETMLGLLRQLAFISKKTGVFVKVTTDFLGDVEMYAESDEIRQNINLKFFEVMARVGEFAASTRENIIARRELKDPLAKGFETFHDFEDLEIYVVAHSEGTVVAYNSLVQAEMVREGAGVHAGDQEFERASQAYSDAYAIAAARSGVKRQKFDWLPRVAGLVTLGSPLDKHYLIWRSRFRKNRLKNNPSRKIRWFNFYDFNDPVAYAIEELQKQEVPGVETDSQRMFDIRDGDLGFQRYPIPGKAHIEYWTDRAIHQRIIDSLMKLTNRVPEPLDTKWWAPFLPLFSWLAYVLGRTATIAAGLFFSNRLLRELPLDSLRSLPVFDRFHAMISAQPLGPESVLLNYAFWLAAPILLMKFFFEAEQGLVNNRNLPAGFRWLLMAAWFAVAFIICLFFRPGGSNGGIPNLMGYATGLFTTILVWRLHTTIHRGLIQLWRYTKVL
ncbi:MAG TPA: hypothetical protein VFI38_03770 [Candidatus Acidoferrum sp.]|nr:hypothetical protein [Candidatus Acidoferrum sp.]